MDTAINFRFWISGNNGQMLGAGRVQLLEKINELGSINKAAKAINMSYKKAWHLINAMNDAAESPLVERRTGGVNGGGTVVTIKGLELVALYRKTEQNAQNYFIEQAKDLNL